jgi:predicted MPP superfamily phosphohydrolase
MDPIFRDAEAPDGRFFVLGNHDARMKSPEAIRSSMVSAGWTDLGGKELSISFRNERVTMIGNEAPWFPHTVVPTPTKDQFCMMLSHSPDQIRWARQHQVHLMIAGHTHGGQGRLPLIGPVLSPSIYGSRFASGQFYLAPTTMHVTRGLSGTRLMRINCRPELSLLTLRSDHPN